MNLDEACIISPHGKLPTGYAMITIGGNKRVYHHRLVLSQKLGVSIASLAGLDCRHKCDNPSCVNPNHLELGTRQQNVQDMHYRGRARKAVGEAASRAKLTESDVRAIRSRRLSNCTELAREFGVSHTAILKIWRRETWKHI